MQNFDKFPKLTEYIAEMANTGKVPKEWSKFLTELNQALQLTQTAVVGQSEQLTYKCDYCQDDGVMITGLDCTCEAAPNKS